MVLEGQTSHTVLGALLYGSLEESYRSSLSVTRENTVMAAKSLPPEHDQKWTGAAQDCQSAWLRALLGTVSTSNKVME